jgi:hypothetical protein
MTYEYDPQQPSVVKKVLIGLGMVFLIFLGLFVLVMLWNRA